MQAMELLCNVYGVGPSRAKRYSSRIKGYDHAAHGLAPSAGSGLA